MIIKKMILIVDDEDDIREILIEQINRLFPEHYKIHEAKDGLQAIRKIENQKYFLIISDIKMPKYDGESLLELITEAREELRPQHILINSGFADIPQLKSTKKTNIYFLPKPISDSSLREYLLSLNINSTSETSNNFKMDVNFINPFINSTLEVLGITANTKIQKDKVYVRTEDMFSGDISAVIPLNSNIFVGSFALCFEKSCYLEVVSNMLMEKYTEINEENRDAVGELGNQIFGLTKAKMSGGSGVEINKAIPTIIIGDNHKIRHMIAGKCIAVRFKTNLGYFSIEAIVRAV
ncbi:MAG: chemotaxis protein CheX [Bacteriovoracaceae bacterium]